MICERKGVEGECITSIRTRVYVTDGPSLPVFSLAFM